MCPQADGTRELSLKFAVCAFDGKGEPLQFVHQDYEAKLTEKQYAEIQTQHGLPHTIVITPPPGTASVRLLVQDMATGQMGSVNLPYAVVTANATAPAGPTTAPAEH
jgi:hypothetical protein